MPQQCYNKPDTRPRCFFRWWLALHSLKKPGNLTIYSFQYISGPSELSFTTAHSMSILILITNIIYIGSSRHVTQIPAQNVLKFWTLPTLLWEMELGEHELCTDLDLSFSSSKQIIFVNWPSSTPSFTHMRSGGLQMLLFCPYLDISSIHCKMMVLEINPHHLSIPQGWGFGEHKFSILIWIFCSISSKKN